MQISDEQIDDFTRSWEIAFSKPLTRDYARSKAEELSALLRALAGPH